MLQKVDRQESQSQHALDAADGGHLSLSEIFGFVWRFKWSVILCCLAPLAVAIAYVHTAPPTYAARAQLLLENKSPIPSTEQSAVNADRPMDSPEIESLIALIRSERIALAVINQLKLWDEPELAGAWANARPETELTPDWSMRRSRAVLTAFGKNLDARRNGLSYAIDIRYSSVDPARSALVANAMAQAFVADLLESRAEAVRAGGRWLEERIEQLRRQMNVASLRVQRFKVRRDYRIVDPAQKQEAPSVEANSEDGERETLEELESRASTYRRIYESYLQAYAESLQRQSFPVANARVITLATRPLEPNWPKPSLVYALALLVGLILGFGQALMRHQFAARSRGGR